MQSQILTMLLGPNNPMAAGIMNAVQNAGLIDIALQAYQAYQAGALPDFVVYQYDNNIHFRKFYDKHKSETLQEFFAQNNINL